MSLKKRKPEEHQGTVVISEMLKLLEMDQGGGEWPLHQEMDQADQLICELPHPARSKKSPRPGAGLVRRYRGKLITSVLRLDVILEVLRRDGILTTANLEAISVYAVQREKQRVLTDLLLRKGDKALEAFLQVLVRSNPCLVRELDHQLREQQVCSSNTSHLRETF